MRRGEMAERNQLYGAWRCFIVRNMVIILVINCNDLNSALTRCCLDSTTNTTRDSFTDTEERTGMTQDVYSGQMVALTPTHICSKLAHRGKWKWNKTSITRLWPRLSPLLNSEPFLLCLNLFDFIACSKQKEENQLHRQIFFCHLIFCHNRFKAYVSFYTISNHAFGANRWENTFFFSLLFINVALKLPLLLDFFFFFFSISRWWLVFILEAQLASNCLEWSGRDTGVGRTCPLPFTRGMVGGQRRPAVLHLPIGFYGPLRLSAKEGPHQGSNPQPASHRAERSTTWPLSWSIEQWNNKVPQYNHNHIIALLKVGGACYLHPIVTDFCTNLAAQSVLPVMSS